MRTLNYLLRVTLSLIMSLAVVHQAHAGAGWGDSTFSTGAPKKVPTYYANSPAGFRPDPFGIGPAIDTGTPLRKFIDPLPVLCGPPGTPIPAITGGNGTALAGKCIPVANPDITTYPDADYYEIGVVEFSEYLHGDLPKPTRLRGYVQLNDPANPVTVVNGVVTSGNPRYLGPIIAATKDRPVRIKYVNLIPTGPNGDLFIPVDKTLMSSGMGPLDANGNPCDPGAPNASCATYTENRAEIHLHGGFTPWISDGTPHQWVVPAGENTPFLKGASFQVVPDMVDPGNGAGTLYYTNAQSSRLMFYHDHVAGLTRLNVYVGEVSGYLVADKPSTGENLLPLPVDQIPLIIQDKTFVPKDINQAVNPTAYAAASALLPNPPGINQVSVINGVGQDEKWDTTHWGQYGDLWFPHVYEFNQDPNSFDATNPVGRWDWGPYFWPVFPADLPLPDGSYGNASTTPEAFNDTPVINGAAYPVLTVDPKAYRFRILNGANDRFFNLGFYVAGKTVQSCSVTSGGAGYDPATTTLAFTGGHDPAIPNAMTPTGTVTVVGGAITAVNLTTFGSAYTTAPTLAFTSATGAGAVATCTLSGATEMVMVPFDSSTTFPSTGGLTGTGWGTPDARVGGVPSPLTAGPDIIQIGTEGGMLPAPVVIPSTPLNYEYNKRSVTVLNVLEKGLFLGAAERADIIVDFSQFAGKTLILYNDSPAPVPAGDPRIDYYTGNPDMSSSGGTVTTQPGVGPNTRTIMQIQVNNVAAAAPYNVAALAAAFPAAYSGTQDLPVVPETVYNPAFNQTWTDTYARIFTGAVYLGGYQGLTFVTPENITYTKAPVCTTPATCLAALPGSRNQTATAGTTVTAYLESKAIQELFDPRGRMNATQGTELLFTTANTQTTIPLGYIDPATETIADGETQFWKITHNGVDTHPVHFHLVNVQLINRVGWDGTVKMPDANEVGWKETVRMNPLEDVIVAIRAKAPPLPFGVPNSSRSLDPSQALGSTMGFNQIDPYTGVPAVVSNVTANFGWEYVWHCHILGHEENDFMRPFVFLYTAVVPDAPTNLTTTTPSFANTPNNITINWVDPTPVAAPTTMSNPKNEIGFSIERCAGLNCSNFAPVGTALANATSYTETALGSDRYSYVVKAYNAAGESASSNIVNVVSNAVIDGICGTSNGLNFSAIPTTGLCASGTSSAVVQNGTILTWGCSGINSTVNGSCTAYIPVYTVTFVPGTNGTIQGTTPQSVIYNLGATTVTAVPNTGYHLVNWTEGATVFGTAPALSLFNVVANHTITANFAIDTFVLNYVAGAGGILTGTTPQTINYFANATTVTATANVGYLFVNWTDENGVVVSVTPDLTVLGVTAAHTYTANFVGSYTATLGRCITGPTVVAAGSLPTYTFATTGFNVAAQVNGVPITLTNGSYTFSTGVTINPVITATFTPNPAVTANYLKLSTQPVGGTGYPSLQSAYAAAATGNTIQLKAASLASPAGALTTNRNITVTLQGGYDNAYTASCGTTNAQGGLTIATGTVIVDNLVIQ